MIDNLIDNKCIKFLAPWSSGDSMEEFERRLREAKNEVGRQKDEELAKMHIQIRKEMDDKLR